MTEPDWDAIRAAYRSFRVGDVPFEWLAWRDAYRMTTHVGLEIDGQPLTPAWYMGIVNLRWSAMVEDELP